MKGMYTIALLILSNGHLKFGEMKWFSKLGLISIILSATLPAALCFSGFPLCSMPYASRTPLKITFTIKIIDSKMTVPDIARMIDHAVLHPTSTDADLRKNCALAKVHGVVTVCVKPYHTALASTLLKGTEVKVCAVIGFPHGNSPQSIKVTEASIVIDEGAEEVDMVVNIGKVIQEDWSYVEEEIGVLQTLCAMHKVPLKVIFETDFVTSDAHKIKLCEICSENQVAFVKTSTGFGYVPVSDGHFTYHGATEHDIKLMREHCLPQVQVKASGGIKTLDQLLRFYELGAQRFGTSSTEAIMAEAKIRFG